MSEIKIDLNGMSLLDVIKAYPEQVLQAIEQHNKEAENTPTNTGSPKLSGAVCRWCYGHKDMCKKCVFGSEFSPAAQHRAGA